jgi:hypothetical protein
LANGFLEPLQIPAGWKTAACCLAVVAVAALGALLLADLGPLVRAFGCIWILAMVASAVRDLWSLRAAGVLELDAGGHWHFRTATGACRAGLRGHWGSHFGPLMGIEWRCDDGQCVRLWLSRLDLPATSWRRLRVRLRVT